MAIVTQEGFEKTLAQLIEDLRAQQEPVAEAFAQFIANLPDPPSPSDIRNKILGPVREYADQLERLTFIQLVP
jgi:hypothetical protein